MARLAGFASLDSNPSSKKSSGAEEYQWLGWQDSNLRMTGPKPVALPLGDSLILLNSSTLLLKSNPLRVILLCNSPALRDTPCAYLKSVL